MSQSCRIFVLPLLLLVLGGCSGSSTSTSSGGAVSSSLTDFCGSICGRVHDCDNTTALQTCNSTCQNDYAATFPKLRSEIVTSIENCLPGKDCATVLKGLALGACSDEASASLAPTGNGTQFCDSWAAATTSCGRTLDKAACLSLAKQYNDNTLVQAQSCTTQSCSNMTTCIEAVLNLSFGGGPSGAVR